MPNITVSVDDSELLREARAIAAREGKSLSGLVRDYLRALVDGARPRDTRGAEAIRLMEKGFSLGGRPLSRDALHERPRRR